ncbi:hypothetical protein [Streptomyces sp. NPDC096030]|uniref:hypothetical protein n=1 Tax=Streptomyces sp. NPDC096030 TaxID=3155423 RepID=UPI003329F996
MARIRSIKPEFFTSLTIADLRLSARLQFIGLWTYVDDNGVGLADPRLIRAAIWPLEEDPEVLQRTREDLQSLHAARLVTLYEASGKALLTVNNWSEHQKVSHPRKPRYPRPEDVRQRQEPPTDLDSCEPPEDSGEAPEDFQRTPESLRPEQGAGSREQGAGKKTPSPPSGTSGSGEPGPVFDEFWTLYPRKAGKSEAAKAWVKATAAGADSSSLLAAAKAHADYHLAVKTEQQFIPHASTWLNQKRYEDEPPQLPQSAGPQTAPRHMTEEEKRSALRFG